MFVDIWTLCAGKFEVKEISFRGLRCVEDQHTSASRSWVDTSDEHDLLEQIIDDVKPLKPKEIDEYDYLLITPFRHKSWSSRFSLPNRRGYLYGSLEMRTCLSEVAYYRFRFFEATKAKMESIDQSLCVFNVEVVTDRFIDLCSFPFSSYTGEITSKISYKSTQALGEAMRKDKISAFYFPSARCEGINLCLLTPLSLKKKHLSFQDKLHLRATITDRFIQFFIPSSTERYEFFREQFLGEDGSFPICKD
ncbi:MAG: RES family NAD+ phosphorylase [Oligoflexales bacterium]|nr:RES family NAD+ phosphorylase [Oligoflexales bacterium]